MSSIPVQKPDFPVDISAYKRYIEEALEYAGGTHSYDDVVNLVQSGTLQFWPGQNSVIITELIDYPQKRIAHVFLAAGKLAEIEAMTPVLIAWSKAQGCVGAQMYGRRGWERTFLTRSGWTPSLVVFRNTY